MTLEEIIERAVEDNVSAGAQAFLTREWAITACRRAVREALELAAGAIADAGDVHYNAGLRAGVHVCRALVATLEGKP